MNVINPELEWSKEWLDRIADLENTLAVKYHRDDGYDICGTKTSRGTPCPMPPLYIHGETQGRCSRHAKLPPVKNLKAGIFNQMLGFMHCDICDINDSGCDQYQTHSDCMIESGLYESIWAELKKLFPEPSLKEELLCEMLVRAYVQKDRCWRYEAYRGTGIYIHDRVMEQEERLLKSIIVILKELEAKLENKEKRKSLFERMGVKNL